MFKKITSLFEAHAFAVLAFSVFGLMFAMRPVTWLPTFILLSCAVAVIFSVKFRYKVCGHAWNDDLCWITAPFALWFFTCLFVGFWHWGLSKYAFPENPFRIFLALGTFGLTVSACSKKSLIAGLAVASICVFLNVLYEHVIHGDYYPRISGTTNHPIHFGNFAALLGVLLTSVALLGRTCQVSVRILCFVGAILAFGATTTSQSRSSFGVLLCLLPLLFVAKTDMMHRWLVRVVYVLISVVVTLVATSPSIQESLRIKEAATDIARVESRDYEGSIGSRLSMWQTAWSIFQEHPMVGVGPHKFRAEFVRRMKSGETPRADADHNQPHNDILNAAATGGGLKLMAYLFLIGAPLMFFCKQYKATKLDIDKRMFPIMGIQVVGAFFITGLTNSNFDLQIYSTSYAVLVCVLAKLSISSETMA